jgi:hypothetical protein
MSPDLRHLLDPTKQAPEPPGTQALPRELQIEPGGGLRVTKIGERVIISDGSEIPIPEGEVSGSTDDPLRFMAYRATLTQVGDDTFVTIQTSYLDSVYYESGWFHENFQIASETLLVTGIPKFLYLKVPIKFISGTDYPLGRTDFPHNTLKSENLVIGGNIYTLYQEFSTGFIVRDRGVTPANYFTLEDNYKSSIALDGEPDTDDRTGNWYFLIANLTAENGVEQIHLGSRTLPQAFQFNLTGLSQ